MGSMGIHRSALIESGPEIREIENKKIRKGVPNLWEWAIALHGRVLVPLGADKFYINYCLRHIVSHN